jgi:hypothetical protein
VRIRWWWKVSISVLLLLLAVYYFVHRSWQNVVDQYGIEYAAIDFDLSGKLIIDQLKLARENELNIEVDQLAIYLDWLPLLQREINVSQLELNGVEVAIPNPAADESTTSGNDLLGGWSVRLENVDLKELNFQLLGKTDSLTLVVPELQARQVFAKDSISIDSLLAEFDLQYAFATINEPADSKGSFSLLPDFSIKHLHFENSALLLKQPRHDHHITDLNLKLNGWKTSELLDFRVQQLVLVYQDSLAVDLSVANGLVRSNLDSEIANTTLLLPGINLNINKIQITAEESLLANVSIGNSTISYGAIKRYFPAILVAMKQDIPSDSVVNFTANLAIIGEQLQLSSLNLQLLTETEIAVGGNIDWAEEPVSFDLQLDRIKTSRQDLFAFLIEEDYNEFFLWPTALRGSGTIRGNLDYFDIQARLQTAEGQLSVQSLISFSPKDDLFYSIHLASDSVLVNRIVDYLPLEVPYGSVDLKLGGLLAENEANDTFRLDLSSRRIAVEGRQIKNVDVTYYYNAEYDSVWATLLDEQIKGNFRGAIYGQDTSYLPFEGQLAYLSPKLLSDVNLPWTHLTADYTGSYDWLGDDFFQVSVTADSSYIFRSDTLVKQLPECHFRYREDKGELYTTLEANAKPVFTLQSGVDILDYTELNTAYLQGLPDTEMYLSLAIDSASAVQLTGYSAAVRVDSLTLKKASNQWEAEAAISSLTYSMYQLDSIQLSLSADSSFQWGRAQIALNKFDNDYFPLDSIEVNIELDSDKYSADINTLLAEVNQRVTVGLEAYSEEDTYVLRLQDDQALLLAGDDWRVFNNQGLIFDTLFSLQAGSIGLERENTRLGLATSAEGNIEVTVDSLALDRIAAAVDSSYSLKGYLDAQLYYQPDSAFISWQALVSDLAVSDYQLGILGGQGFLRDDSLEASLKLWNEDTLATFRVVGLAESLVFDAVTEQLSLDFLTTLPSWPENVGLSGLVEADLSGKVDSTLQLQGYAILSESILNLYDYSTSLSIPNDTLYFTQSELDFKSFEIYDLNQKPLTVSGSTDLSAEPRFDIRLKTEQFSLLNSKSKQAIVRGNLELASDLRVSGRWQNLGVSGGLSIQSGGMVEYLYQSTVGISDASGTVTFVEFDKIDQLGANRRASKSDIAIDWNVDTDIQNITLEVLLNEITQEFVRVTGGGNLRLRGENTSLPLVYGSLSASSGRALLFPPVIPDLDLNVEKSVIAWEGEITNPKITFQGVKTVKAKPTGLSPVFSNRNELVQFQVMVLLNQATLEDLDLSFDMRSLDSEVNTYLQGLAPENRESYAINLLAFGSIGTENIAQGSAVLGAAASKLNEIANRNLTNTDVSFGVETYEAVPGAGSNQTNVNYSVSRSLFKNRLQVAIGGDLGVSGNNVAGPGPTANIIDNVELSYILSRNPFISLNGARKYVYEGIVDGDVIRSSIGVNFRKSYPTLNSIFRSKSNASNP